MKYLLRQLFGRKETKAAEYSGFSDFFRHAPLDTKKKVFREVAKGANEDQIKIYRNAQVKAPVS